MRISHAHVIMFLFSMCVGACAAEDLPDSEESIGVSALPLTSDGCPGPRPKNRGCRLMCKPCAVAYCEDGQWVYEMIDWGDECNGGGGSGGGNCCQVPISGGCPAECACCNYTP